MANETQVFKMYAGQDLNLVFDVTDITGAAKTVISGHFYMAARADSPSPLISKDSTSGVTVSGNQITVAFATTDTSVITPGTYYYEVWGTDALSKTVPVASGSMIILSTLG